jgi:hypothetical protein
MKINYVHIVNLNLYSNRKNTSLLNNHINLFLSDNSEKKLLFILEKKVFLAKEYLLHLINKCSSSSTQLLTEMKINYVHIVNLNLYSNRKNT